MGYVRDGAEDEPAESWGAHPTLLGKPGGVLQSKQPWNGWAGADEAGEAGGVSYQHCQSQIWGKEVCSSEMSCCNLSFLCCIRSLPSCSFQLFNWVCRTLLLPLTTGRGKGVGELGAS